MTQPHDPHPHDPNDPASPQEEQELRAVAALLRGLPDPEPPEDLSERVMAEVRRRESGPRVLRGAFRRFEPVVTTALAAGLGAVVLLTAVQSGLFPPGEPYAEGLQPSVATRVSGDAPIAVTQARRVPAPSLVSLPSGELRSANLLGVPLQTGLADSRAANPIDRRLDRQLNSLLLDPEAFYRRLAHVSEPDRFVARLADRAARRGDAAEIAMQLRRSSPEHPDTARMVERLMWASITRQVPLR